ncbi:hypothetical protein [Roseobacter litoralis]|uniref:hypothetical protein n=1 Tax=Roseobacter litoralis TaxID=42443 RepID=UPI0024949B10|nr:hypothetical protein [Roseobacter litoralis]
MTKARKIKNTRRDEITPNEAREAVMAYESHGSTRLAAEALGISRPALMRRRRKADLWGITAHGEVVASQTRSIPAPTSGVTRFILTAAQSNTKVHAALWENINALADHYGAEIMVGRIRYNHTAAQVGQEVTKRAADESLWYDAALEPYFSDERIEIAPGLLWVGDMNIIPTATNPLSGLDSFAGAPSCIFPHPQIALKSVATAPPAATKMLYTTGSVTLKNYIKRKAGLKAEFHHAYAALIVEVDSDGDWFARQINADSDGVIHDLDVRVEAGKASTGQPIEVLTPGDIHGTEIDPTARQIVWGGGGIVDTLKPRRQVLHDVLNFGRRSHHNTVFDLISAHYNRAESVEGEIEATAAILETLLRPGMETFVVKSNHDEHLDRWVTEADFRRDPINASFYLEAAGQKVAALKRRDAHFDLAEWALKKAGLSHGVRFLARDERLEIAGIRHDQHGDQGPNGARGSAMNLSRTGEKTNIGHSHSAGIVHGCYQMGTMSVLMMGYNQGPSSWSHSLIFTYANRKRAIITLKNGKWRAT